MSLVLPRIPELDSQAAAAARARQATLTKPPGSMGRLEDLAVWYAAVRGTFPVPVPAAAELFVFAADHGVAAEGVSAYPATVTAAMLANFRAGGAAVNVLARQCGLTVTAVDVGVATEVPRWSRAAALGGAGFVDARVRAGTANLRHQPAMTLGEAERAMGVGLRMADAAIGRGCEILVGGDMGIANTTAAAGLLCAFGGDDPRDIVGRGTGIDDAGLARKAAVIRDALALHRPDPSRVLETLAALGGLEIAALAGLMWGGAARRVPVVVDGFIAGAAALVATRLDPKVRPFLLLSHLSAERGARRLCDLLGAPGPLLDLSLRLGEGTGAALVVPLLRTAVALQTQMATFAEAAVPNRPTD
ncbi:MAG: nicotinate-nucleotide--dimethylbenzimidazole phosphoribosyltransferase [Pseudomonadota bacterium]